MPTTKELIAAACTQLSQLSFGWPKNVEKRWGNVGVTGFTLNMHENAGFITVYPTHMVKSW